MASMAMESIRLWLALTPKQFEDLNNGKEIQPDEYSKRFGLRKDPVAAVERAQYFDDWTPEGPKGEFCAKDYVLVEVELTAIGYLQKAEAGILLKYKPNEYRWQGTMKAMEFDQNGNLLYKFARGRSPDRLSTEEISSQCVGFWNGPRPGGSARLGSRRQMRGEMQKLW